MPGLFLHLVTLLLVMTWVSPVAAAPTPAQRCEADVELASAKFAQCRLTAEAKYSKSLDADKRTAALARCSDKLQQSFAKAVVRYGLNCTDVPVAEFDAYLKQCSDDTTAAAGGAALPDYVGDLASCYADLSTCDGNLASCSTDLATTIADLAACEALPPARLLKTGQTTSYGPGSDGDLQVGVARGYVDNGDGTITDMKTGLMWEKKSDDGTVHDKDNGYSWSDASYGTTNVLDGTVAASFLAALNAGDGFAGHTDWRLPNLNELLTIVDWSTFNPATSSSFNENCSPGCSVTTCSCTRSALYWTSSTYAFAPDRAWLIDFYPGTPYYGHIYKESVQSVRAVRGGS